MIGLLTLDFVWGTPNTVLLFCIIFLVFCGVLILMIYLGGRAKIYN